MCAIIAAIVTTLYEADAATKQATNKSAVPTAHRTAIDAAKHATQWPA
jgi:hypothetical protein